MASEVDICNVALGHLGDNATVASLNPPEGSAQAEHCARFYPIARDALLEAHNWGFSMRRVALAQLVNPWPEWRYAYALPTDSVNMLAVLDPGASDDYNMLTPVDSYDPTIQPALSSQYSPQPFTYETDASGVSIIYTNQANAVLRYTALVTDTTQFSPLFTTALTWLLASMLAGPVIKGDAGAAESQRCEAIAKQYLAQATSSDANQRSVRVQHVAPWVAGRY